MFWTCLHSIDITLWLLTAFSVAYVAFFVIVSLIVRTRHKVSQSQVRESSFLVLFPAYSEDKVIVRSVENFLLQSYSSERYHVAVISDHQKPVTNQLLSQLPISLLQPSFDHSSKAKALQYAIANMARDYDYVMILDADNIVNADFLRAVNNEMFHGHKVLQCHRCAKNSDSSISVLDGVSEEINNTIFRRAHNAIGLSSALIGSGMCFDYQWFASHVNKLSTAGEDRELEAMLLRERVFISYADDILVYDEKVSSEDNFQRQRQRWMSAQIRSLIDMLPHLPKAMFSLNVNYVDKTIQQMLIPRSMLLVGTLFFSVLTTLYAPWWSLKWWLLFAMICLSLFMAIPQTMRTRALFGKVSVLGRLTWKMLKGVRHIDHKNKDFLHTTHE